MNRRTMTTKWRTAVALAALLALGDVGGIARAAERSEDQKDTAALANMKMTLPQAIATAEQQVGGKAVGADVMGENGATRIAVEVAGPAGVKTVLVDAQSGKVTATHDGGGDSEDND